MMQNSYYDDVLSSLVRRVNYLERRLVIAETGELAGGLTHGVLLGLDADDHPQYAFRDEAVTYVGTPTATYYAVWDGPGTLSASALNTSSFVISQGVLGGQTIAGGDSMSDGLSSTLTVYGTYYNGGTLNPNYEAIKIMPARGLSPSLHTTMYHNGNWIFSRNVNIQGTLTILNVTGPTSFTDDVLIADKIIHIGDADTAFRFPADDTVTIETAGQEHVRVTSAGRVGLNTNSPERFFHVQSPDTVSMLLRNNSSTGVSFDLQSTGTNGQLWRFFSAANIAGRIGNLEFQTGGADSDIRMAITNSGNVGIGTTSPRGRLHVHDGTGGSLFWTATGIAGSAVTIIPDGTGDVVRKLTVQGVVRGSNGNTRAIAFSEGASSSGGVLTPGGAELDLFDSATNVVKLRVNANGSVDVRRTAGTLTYDVALHLVWL